ncbi:WecB/TagA/CpsF family glycosyltransferase [Salinicola endophyticus]|uniref:WecB/TagA/CpsF family glycosyltransferase n=1 Tax=Salinicola endophyticus TaxID=1949083 RepID=A0ABY8FFX0_9GAMM|nr:MULTISPECIES: WecB/TagA/CpsF family glycosyltransferase [Salinicola]WFF41699.1 WecB/TagA/CpsF family glycosyltransferase [Salinicola endophyticus]
MNTAHLDTHTSTAFVSPAPEQALATAPLFGLSLVSATLEAAVDAITERAAQRTPTTINFINAHCVNVTRRDAQYRQSLAQTDLLLPDGSGIRIASKLAGSPLGDNLNGTDLFPALCDRAATRGLSIYLLGGSPGTAAKAADAMQQRYPTLDIAGTQHGFFAAEETELLISRINRAKPDLLFVGFGVPIQENWIAENRHRLQVPVVLGVGGLFDYYADNVSRAPAWVRRCGCEWMWRLAQEPRRLAQRYLIGNVTFLAHATLAGLKARLDRTPYHAALKRLVDVTIAGSALLVLAPLFALISLAIRTEDRGPALFRQRRIGANGKPFMMLKFRSMVRDAEARRAELLASSERDGVCFKMKRDPRITRVGAWLRKTSLDELPQLINVLRGDMSIVGPRPALPDEVITYRDASWQRLGGKPGITCTWQVSGRADIPFEQQVVMDIDYLNSRSILRDFALMLRTVPAVLSRRGAY